MSFLFLNIIFYFAFFIIKVEILNFQYLLLSVMNFDLPSPDFSFCNFLNVFLSTGLRISNEQQSVSSTFKIPALLSNSPQ